MTKVRNRAHVICQPALMCAAVLSTAVAPAAAQTTTPPAVTAAADEPVGDIIVTANRREERLQDVPSAISAIDGDELARVGVSSTLQLTQIAPSLNFVIAGSAPQPTIRGIGSRGTNAGDESIVPIYIDGVYQPFAPGLVFEMADVQRVEVLRGPQGTLYGRNATGGAINIVTRTPSDQPSGYIDLGYGSFHEVELKGYATVGSPVFQASLSGYYQDDDGYQRDVGPRGGRLARQNNFVVRPKIRCSPSDRFDITGTLSVSDSFSNAGIIYRPIDGNTSARRTLPTVEITAPYSRQASATFEPSYKVTQTAGSIIANVKLDALTITSITGSQANTSQLNSDSDGTYVNTAFNRNFIYDNSFNQELYATSAKGGPFRWTIGAFYFYDEAGYNNSQTSLTARTRSGVTTNAYALYGEGTLALTDTVEVTLGGRYSRERKRAFVHAITLATGATVSTANARSWGRFTPSGTIRWAPSDSFSLYAKAGQAFKSGVYNLQQTARADPVNQELVTSYEIGVKSDPTRWLRANVAGYYTKYENLQATARDPVTNNAFLQNAAGAEIYGVEADVLLRPARGFNLRFGLAATHGEFTSFPGAQANIPLAATSCALVNGVRVFPCGNQAVILDLKGYTLPKMPDLALTAGFDYAIPIGDGALTIAGNAYRAGKSFWYADNRLRQDPYVLVGGSATFAFGADRRFSVAVWGENLANAKYQLSLLSTTTGDLAIDNKPPSGGVRFGVRW